jgi:hypothetical protein
MQLVSYMAGVAAETTLSSTDLGRLRIQLVADAGAALLVLLVATTLSVYKPWGLTPYGRRKQHERRQVSQPIPPQRSTTTRNRGDTHMADRPSDPDSNDDTGVRPERRSTTSTPWVLYVLLGIIGLILLIGVLHLMGGGLSGLHTP